jgi:hypothetical protein
MHIKDYPTHPENIELKECQTKDPKILLRIVRRTYNNMKIYSKATQQEIPMHKIKPGLFS